MKDKYGNKCGISNISRRRIQILKFNFLSPCLFNDYDSNQLGKTLHTRTIPI